MFDASETVTVILIISTKPHVSSHVEQWNLNLQNSTTSIFNTSHSTFKFARPFKTRVILSLSLSFPSKPPLRSLTRLRKSWAALCSSGEPICPSQTEGGNAANYGLQMWETTVNTLLSRAKHDFVISSDLHIFQVLQNGIPRVRVFRQSVKRSLELACHYPNLSVLARQTLCASGSPAACSQEWRSAAEHVMKY